MAQEFYQDRISVLQIDLKKLKQKKSNFAWLRLGAIVAIFFAFYLLWSFGAVYAIIAAVFLLAIFIRLIYTELDIQAKIEHIQQLILINEEELKNLAYDYYDFPDGAQHMPKDHPYANDLDIFGRASLFQYINRTTSEAGSEFLAGMLSGPADIDTIYSRQGAVKELASKPGWIQELQAFGRKKKITLQTQKRLYDWMQEPPVFTKFRHWKWLRYVLPLIIITLVTAYIFDEVGDGIFYFTVFIFAVIAYRINKYVAPVHDKLSKVAEELHTLSDSIRLIENEDFKDPFLIKLQGTLIESEAKASDTISAVKKILDKLDLRYNMVLAVPLYLLLLWHLQQLLDLEKWKLNQKKVFDQWFDTLAQFEALNSFAVLHFNHPAWVFPTVNETYFSISGTAIGHPLIPENKRVDNFIDISGNDLLMLVTGSNMAGKSTYLRSIGVNAVLAMAGAPVCATDFNMSHAQVISSMRITDNLEESTSTFYAELKKLKTIIEKVNAGERVFILLDEILRGTNSLDRHTGSKALIQQLISKKAAAIIATHDLELAHLKEDFTGNILNYHFDVQVSNDELYFDYQLKPGICNSLNASILMRKIGIEL